MRKLVKLIATGGVYVVLIAVFAMTALAGPWMLTTMIDYVRRLFQGIPGIVG